LVAVARKSPVTHPTPTARYGVLWTSTAGEILGVGATSVVDAAKRHEQRFGQRVMWGRAEVSELGSVVVHEDWVRERARAKFGHTVDFEAHVMVLPRIEGLAVSEEARVVGTPGDEFATRMQEALAVADSNAREANAERLARLESEAEHARRETARLRNDLAVARRVISEMAGVFGGADGPDASLG